MTEAASGESSLDFDLGFDQAAGAEPKDESGLDLDLTSIGGEGERPAADAGGSSSVDFDLGEGAVAEAGAGSMDFDLSGIDESGAPSTETPVPERASGGGSGLDFDLEGLGEGTLVDGQVPPEAAESPATADADLGELDFDLEGIDDVGEDRVLWGNDYPHYEGTFPYNTESLRLTFGAIPEERRRKILGLNAAKLYNFDVEKLMPLAREHGPTPEEVNTPLPKDEIPRDSMCYLFTNALYGA